MAYRKRVKLFPGVHLNLSGSGASLSVGVPGATVNFSERGIYGTVGIPGSGWSERRRLDGPGDHTHRPSGGTGRWTDGLEGTDRQHVTSARVDAIQSASLADFQAECAARHREVPTLQAAGREATRELDELTRELAGVEGKFVGALRRRHVQDLRDRADIAKNIVDGLKAQIDDLRVDLTMELNEEVASAVGDVVEAFNAMASSEMVWDVTEVRDGGAGLVRHPVKFDTAGLYVFKTNQPSCRFANANSGDLYLYPGFLAIADGSKLALLDLSEVEFSTSSTQFVESERVPPDAKRVGTQWLRTNADGTPDREFKSNRELPLVEYGILDIRSPNGINERYMVSDIEATTVFGAAMDLLKQALVS